MTESLRNDIIRLSGQGLSQRRIALQLRLSRDTVQRVLRQVAKARNDAPAVAMPSPASRPRPAWEGFDDVCRQLLERYPQLTAQRLFEELRQRGFRGSYATAWRRLQELRPTPVKLPVVRFETTPGAQAQMDYATYTIALSEEGPRRLQLFSYLLAYSRRQYLCFVERQDFDTTLRQHLAAFTHLGGVAATCLYDNFKVVVQGYDDDEPIYNPRFLAFATHYGFRPWACRPHRPQTKGKAERPFRYVETSLLCGRDFRTLAHLNDTTRWWLAHVADVRLHGETRERPLDRHAQELPHLLPLPTHPYDLARVVYRHVSAEGLVAWQTNLYSVPWRLIGRLLAVRITADELIVYGPRLEEVARHCLLAVQPQGQRSVQPEHQPQTNERLRRATLEERFAELGELGPRFLAGLVQSRRFGWDQARRLLELLTIYRKADVQAALERAMRFGAFELSAVQRILSAMARPKPMLEVLADEERRRLDPLLRADPVPPRPLSAYQHLTGDPHAQASPASDPPPGEHPPTDQPGHDRSPPTIPGGPSGPESRRDG